MRHIIGEIWREKRVGILGNWVTAMVWEFVVDGDGMRATG